MNPQPKNRALLIILSPKLIHREQSTVMIFKNQYLAILALTRVLDDKIKLRTIMIDNYLRVYKV